jgi:hypothetical protein
VTMNEAQRSRGEAPARRREEPPVAVLELGAPNGAAEHLHLVAEHGVLELELRHAPTSGEPSDEANKDEVGEGSQRARDATHRRQSQGFEFWSPTGREVNWSVSPPTIEFLYPKGTALSVARGCCRSEDSSMFCIGGQSAATSPSITSTIRDSSPLP